MTYNPIPLASPFSRNINRQNNDSCIINLIKKQEQQNKSGN